jgi:hypothetical protein
MYVYVNIAIELYCIRDMLNFFYKKKTKNPRVLAALVPSLALSFSERAARVVVRAHSGLLVWEPQGLIVAIGALSIIGALFLKMRPWGACRRAGRGGGRQVKPRRRLFLCPYHLFQSPYRLIGRSRSRTHGLLRKQRRFPRILAGNYHYSGRSNPQFATNRQAQGGPPAAAAYASAYVSIRQGIRQGIRQHTSASRGPLIVFYFFFLSFLFFSPLGTLAAATRYT